MKRHVVLLLTLGAMLLVATRAAAQTPPGPTASPAPLSTATICSGSPYPGGQTAPLGPLQVVLPATGNFTVTLNAFDPAGQSISVCYIEGNSSVTFTTNGVERSQVVNNLAASAVLNQISLRLPPTPSVSRPMPVYTENGVQYFATILDRNGLPAVDGSRVLVGTTGSILRPGTSPQVCLDLPVSNGRVEFSALTGACPEDLGPVGMILDLRDGQAPITASADTLFEWRRAYVGEAPHRIVVRPIPPPTGEPQAASSLPIRPPTTGDGGLR